MIIAAKCSRRFAIALLGCAASASAGAPYEVVAPDVEFGGGTVAGGVYAATTTIASADAAPVMAGGVYEATAGVERRRLDTRGDAMFVDGFE